MTRMNMRFTACARITVLSSAAVLLSACSWFGHGGGQNNYQNNYQAQSARYNNSSAQYSVQNGRKALGRCQITAPTQRIPQGCRPEQVTLALGGSQAGYGNQAQYTSGGYGSHVGAARTAQANYAPQPTLKKPKLRGQFGLEIDHSVSGNLYTTDSAPVYNRADFVETRVAGVVVDGDQRTLSYTGVPGRVDAPNISFDDVYTAPFRISGGLEYIFNDHNTVFASVGFTRAEGKKGGGAAIIDGLRRTETIDSYDAAGLLTNTQVNTLTFPNVIVATYDYDFSELERLDFELGGRHYFNPIFRNQFVRPITPFVSASGGAAYYSDMSVSLNQRQLFQEQAFETGLNTMAYYDVNSGTSTQVYESQWVPYGAVKGGVEWQVTPKTALAFEAGVKYEGARDYLNGTVGDDNITIPVTIRGSYNF